MKRFFAAALAVALLFVQDCRAAGTIPSVSAASAILVEASTGRVLYEKDAHTRRPIASTTKLMTALVAVELSPDLSRMVTVKSTHMAEGSSMYLRPGEEVSLSDLLYGLLLSSGNDAALAIAEGCAGSVEGFVERMNEKAQALGMADTHFANPNGLDAEGHYSTAYDMALLGRAALENSTLAQIVATRSATVAGRSLTNHNKLLWRCEGCTGMKTGYTEKAGRTLVSSACREGMTLVCVTLKAPNDWADHAGLYDYGFANWRLCPLAREGKTVRTLRVSGSLIPTVTIETDRAVAYPLGAGERLTAKLELPRRLAAPLERGEAAGSLRFFLGDVLVGETGLVCGEKVPQNRITPNFLDRFLGKIPACGTADISMIK